MRSAECDDAGFVLGDVSRENVFVGRVRELIIVFVSRAFPKKRGWWNNNRKADIHFCFIVALVSEKSRLVTQ